MSRIAMLLMLLLPALAHAEPPAIELGARIGGYGFRESGGGSADWDDCRMNGIGIFAERSLSGPWFVEGGLDTYFAAAGGGHEHSAIEGGAMDRVSGLLTVAGGARFFRDSVVSPYLELGTGVELTRVSAPGIGEGSFVLPVGFFGIGGDLRLGRFRFGMTLRVNAMGHFDHGPGVAELAPEAELATQGQFYARIAL